MSKNENTGKQGMKFEIPNFELPRMEVPAAFRELAEKSFAQSKENYDRFKQTAEQTTNVLEGAFSAYSKGSMELSSKILDNAQDQTNALFDFFKSLLQSGTVAEAFEKQTSFVRRQCETLTEQGREIQQLTAKIANDTSEPISTAARQAVEDTFRETFNRKTA